MNYLDTAGAKPSSKTRDSEIVEQMSNMKEVLCPDSKCSWYKYQYVSPLL